MSLTVVCGAEIAQWVGEMKNLDNIKVNDISVPNEKVENVPAWSLHRLMEIAEMDCFNSVATAYDEVIREIKFQHGEGYINKEYLKQ